MPVRIRLQRHGRKGRPIFSIVAADSRSPRDGRFIEKIGQYNPNTNPATIELNFDSALEWLQKGAQPSDHLVQSTVASPPLGFGGGGEDAEALQRALMPFTGVNRGG